MFFLLFFSRVNRKYRIYNNDEILKWRVQENLDYIIYYIIEKMDYILSKINKIIVNNLFQVKNIYLDFLIIFK